MEVKLHTFLMTALDGVGGQLQVPVALPKGQQPPVLNEWKAG